ncbi:MAG: hypothetical protein LBR16_08025 [Treponema sp.]|jgi:hypothetical protein|nr:hypothetical protein [Treponema sp.]
MEQNEKETKGEKRKRIATGSAWGGITAVLLALLRILSRCSWFSSNDTKTGAAQPPARSPVLVEAAVQTPAVPAAVPAVYFSADISPAGLKQE